MAVVEGSARRFAKRPLAAGLGVLLMGNLVKSVLGGSSIIADFAAIFGAGFYAAVAYYALAKIGL